MGALAELAERFEQAWDASAPPGERTYRELLERPHGEPPSAYPVTATERRLALGVSEQLVDAGAAVRRAHPVELGGEDAPQPQPEARIVPRD